MAKEKTKEENILDEIKSLKESMNILADSVTTLNRNGLTTSIPATEVNKVVNAAKEGVRQAATHVQLPAPDLSPQTDDIADAVATKVVSQMDDNLDNMISKKTVKIKVEHNHYHYNRMFCNWASSETNRKTMCVLAGIIAVLAIAIGVMLYYYFHSVEYAAKGLYETKIHPKQNGKIVKKTDFIMDEVYRAQEEGWLDEFLKEISNEKKRLKALE